MISSASAISSMPTSPMWPKRRIRPTHLPWPPAIDQALAPHGGVERRPLDAVRQPGGGDGAGPVACGGHQAQPERLEAGLRCRRRSPRGGPRCARAPPPAGAARRSAGRTGRPPPGSTASGPSPPTCAPRRSPSRRAACGPSRRPSCARSPMAAIAMPGEAIHAFWLALTTRSMPQASISNGMAPRPLMPSTMTSGSPGRSADGGDQLAQRVGDAGRGLVVGEQHGPIRRLRGRGGRASAAGSAASPHSTSKRSTSAPKAGAISAKRSPKPPMVTASTRSPGERRVDDGGLHRPRAGAGQQQRRRRGADQRRRARW